MISEFGRKRRFRKLAAWAAALLLVAIAFLGFMYREATADPVVRRAEVRVSGISAPLRVLLISDIHVAGPDMPPSRLRRIVGKLNALNPDVVLIAGDFVSDKRVGTRRYALLEALAPLGELRARFGTAAVLGNHDHWRDAGEARLQLRRAGIRVLDNDVARMGPLTVGGVDDPFTGQDDLPAVVQRMRALPPPHVILSHSPDIFPAVPRGIALTVAGHSHCGQIRLPLIGAIATMSAFGERYACGRVDENGKTLIVSAGVGTSLLPLRLGAPPDVWLVELRPASAGAPPR